MIFIGYILYPTTNFPKPPPYSMQSGEKADTESPFRKAYFTNFNRAEVVAHYYAKLNYLPILRLNHPPEDAQTIIRDQTRSTYLEELAHPFRESIFINGFEPSEAKDDIWYKGKNYEQKITIRYVPVNRTQALLYGSLGYLLSLFIFRELRQELKLLKPLTWPKKK